MINRYKNTSKYPMLITAESESLIILKTTRDKGLLVWSSNDRFTVGHFFTGISHCDRKYTGTEFTVENC